MTRSPWILTGWRRYLYELLEALVPVATCVAGAVSFWALCLGYGRLAAELAVLCAAFAVSWWLIRLYIETRSLAYQHRDHMTQCSAVGR